LFVSGGGGACGGDVAVVGGRGLFRLFNVTGFLPLFFIDRFPGRKNVVV
jgi:hypothetical protein